MPGRGANGPPGSGPGSNSARGSVGRPAGGSAGTKGVGRGRGFAAKAKAGDTREMGGVTLVAVNRDGGIAWEAVDPPASVACRETQRHAERDEARWLLQQEQQVKDARTLEARELQRRETERKAQLLGADSVYRTSKTRGPLVQPSKLLLQTREEEAAARAAGMPQRAPQQYLFIKESLEEMERKYAAQERAAREKAYERNRRKLRVAGTSAAADSEEPEGEEEDLRSRLAKMTDEEFKALAMARKARADSDVRDTSHSAAAAAAGGGGGGGGGGGNGRRSKGKQRQQGSQLGQRLAPGDDPDYRR